MKLLHVSITALDANRLSLFYRDVFGYVERRLPRRLSGKTVSRGNGLPDTNIYSIWLSLPEDKRPFLEILQYSRTIERTLPRVNETGLGHLAFGVQDIEITVDKILKNGGALQGEVVNLGSEQSPCLVVYVRDPEGNILELEQILAI